MKLPTLLFLTVLSIATACRMPDPVAETGDLSDYLDSLESSSTSEFGFKPASPDPGTTVPTSSATTTESTAGGGSQSGGGDDVTSSSDSESETISTDSGSESETSLSSTGLSLY